ncbi:hypothetical protein Pst134EA_013048 [Puccinia striiformis f. sp. tritici]|uniref:hypothetical protein n=1 Tax=Puccinia striiformis f. sp. tritici TaxID=168172 RepID=UPI000A124873|nr:hypothetical protein Pst134EA_013048 [Puccinia striiformis f. sp. tritici]KAH9465155.1 hypothetical protein Pst134EA_013048 [Puccinia striiformis f. sp. tritici]KAI9621981.1 hypothetical protein H4Q26_015419 [Puccinia striiformis f. sp. tritici PST-130]
MFNTIITRSSQSTLLLIIALSAGLTLAYPYLPAPICYQNCPGGSKAPNGQPGDHPYQGRPCLKENKCRGDGQA